MVAAPLSLYKVGDSGPDASTHSCLMSSGGESGSDCRAVNAVVGEEGLTSGKIDKFSLSMVNDNDIDHSVGCMWLARSRTCLTPCLCQTIPILLKHSLFWSFVCMNTIILSYVIYLNISHAFASAKCALLCHLSNPAQFVLILNV